MGSPEVLYPLIRAALADGGLTKFNEIAGLPGMTGSDGGSAEGIGRPGWTFSRLPGAADD